MSGSRAKAKPGVYADAVLAQLEASAGSGTRPAPSHSTIARAIGCSTSVVQREIDVMIRDGVVDMRIDVSCAFRRSYHIVASGLKTLNFDISVPRDVVRVRVNREAVVQKLIEIAKQGGAAPRAPVLARQLRTYPAQINRLLLELWVNGTIEVRRLVGHDRAYHVKASGHKTKGFDGGFAMTPPQGRAAYNKPSGEIKNTQGRKRPCITCHNVFMSEGAHNRMCSVCRATAEPVAIYSVQAV